MSRRRQQRVVMIGMALALSVVPTIGSSGMGTIGQRFVHADDALFEQSGDQRHRALLLQADRRVTAEVAGLLQH